MRGSERERGGGDSESEGGGGRGKRERERERERERALNGRLFLPSVVVNMTMIKDFCSP